MTSHPIPEPDLPDLARLVSLIDGVFANVADRLLEVQAKHHVEIA